jgi:glycosyltransferase involved in cell wall biosynthesis
MHVGMLLDKPYPPDVRVRKEADALLSAGHTVDLLCETDGTGDEPRRETVDGIAVFRHEQPTDARTRWPETLRALATHVHPRWARRLRDHVETRGVDVLHVHDLPLVATALAVREETGVPVVADLHENYPEAVRQWRRMDDLGDLLTPARLAERVCLPIRRLRWLERHCVRRADHVVTVVAEGRDHYVYDCRGPPDSISVVSNTVDLSTFDPGAVERPIRDAPASAFVVGYVGKYAPHRGLETVVRALPALGGDGSHAPDDGRSTRLRVVGAPGTPTYGEQFDALCAELGVTDRVTFTGWVDFADVPAQMAGCDVCVVPHAATPHTETTVPHKLFQYMAMGKPVVVTDVAPLARIVGETDSGLVVPAGDSAAMADAVARLRDDPALCAELGRNGRTAVEETYNWDRDARRLVAVYERLADRVSAASEAAV